jgi:RNA polymerase sigma factor (sigma-70 family)
LIYSACKFSTSDADQAADCFLFACEQLSRNNYRRLRSYRPEGPASFATWLRVVVKNLCLDWRRKQFGRPRLFRSIAKLPQLALEVYRCRYLKGQSPDETFMSLGPRFPGLTLQRIIDTEAEVRQSLTPNQMWLIGARKLHSQNFSAISQEYRSSEGNTAGEYPVDPGPDQELQFAQKEEEERLRSVLAKLPAIDRLLLRLRFEEDLSLEQIGRVTGFGDAQRVHRRLSQIFATLRKKLPRNGER